MGVNSLYCLAKLPISRADSGLRGSTFPLDALTLVNVRIQRTLGFRPQLGCLSIHGRAAQYLVSVSCLTLVVVHLYVYSVSTCTIIVYASVGYRIANTVDHPDELAWWHGLASTPNLSM